MVRDGRAAYPAPMKMSGAEHYSREVAAAIAAGTVRRAYLKGLGDARGCAAPAAPIHPEPRA